MQLGVNYLGEATGGVVLLSAWDVGGSPVGQTQAHSAGGRCLPPLSKASGSPGSLGLPDHLWMFSLSEPLSES